MSGSQKPGYLGIFASGFSNENNEEYNGMQRIKKTEPKI